MPSTMTLLESALDYHDRGWSIFPLSGKSPRVPWKDYQSNKASRQQVEQWWTQWPDAGIGVVLGSVSGIVRLDCDGDSAVLKMSELLGSMPDTIEFRTPNHGVGWLLEYEEGTETEVLWKGQSEHEELRLLSDGAYTVVPPSPHPEGGEYEWVTAPWGSVVAKMPVRMKDHLRSARAGRLLRELDHELRGSVEQPDRALLLEALEHLPEEYSRHYDTWVQVGMALHSIGDDMLETWDTWSQRSPDKYTPGDCDRKWSSFVRGSGVTGRTILHWAKVNGWVQPKEPPLTDLGNAKRIVNLYRDTMRYCHTWKKWLIWDGTRWNMDDRGTAMRNAMAMSEKLLDESRAAYVAAVDAARATDANDAQGKKKRANRMFAFAMTSQEERHIRAALTLAQNLLPVLPSELDKDDWLFNCPNGTLDLRTGLLREHRREDYLTKLCPTEYSPDASCPRWLQFLNEVFDGNQQLIAWVQRLFGYCLTGDTSEHVLPIFWGAGANGKSTLLSTAFSVLGPDYTDKAPRDLLLSTKNVSHPTILATLFGKRLVAAVETGDGARLDEVAVKELTGNDMVSCRRMYEDFWSFIPTHKLLLATNHQPEVRGTDHAIWRRLKLVPFVVVFDAARRDLRLVEKLAAEAHGILRWMVEGCAAWKQDGLGEPDVVREATQSYRADQDRLSEFIAMYYEMRSDCRVKIADVSNRYSLWCQLNKEMKLSGYAFGKAMQERGITRDPNKKYYVGLAEKVDRS